MHAELNRRASEKIKTVKEKQQKELSECQKMEKDLDWS